LAFRRIASLPRSELDLLLGWLLLGRLVVDADFVGPFFMGISLMNSTDS